MMGTAKLMTPLFYDGNYNVKEADESSSGA